MHTDTETPHPVVPGHRDPIRIVPLHVPDAVMRPLADAAATTPPRLTYRGGPLLARVEVVTIYWGAAWQQPPAAALATRLDAFFDYVLTSPLLDQLAEYSVPAYAIGHGRHAARVVVTTPAPHRSVSDAAIQHLVQQEIAARSVPAPGANTLYFVYLPPGVRVIQGGSASCLGFCGYHSDIAGQVYYAAMPYPGCAGCTGGLDVFDALTSTSSHELAEAITDPVPGRGWYDDVHGEIGDICAWQTRKLGQYTVQLEWSNRAGRCV